MSVAEQSTAATQLATVATNASQLSNDNLQDVRQVFDAIETLVAISGEELSHASKFDVPNKVARLSMADHVIWKKRLVDMFAGRVTLDPSDLTDRHSCRMGKWYYGPDGSHHHGEPLFQALESPHGQVHELGLRAVRAFNAGRRDEALACIKQVETVSSDLLDLLGQFVHDGHRKGERAA